MSALQAGTLERFALRQGGKRSGRGLEEVPSRTRGPVRERVERSVRAFSATARHPALLRAQLSFGAAWTAEWSFMVALGVIAFRDAGPTAVGIVGFARAVPAVVLAPFGAALGDRFRRERLLLWSCVIRAAATAAAGLLLATDGSHIAAYALAALATAAFTVFRPVHSALLPGLCTSPAALTSANTVRGLCDSLSMLLGPLAAGFLLAVGGPSTVFALVVLLSLGSGLLLFRLPYEAPEREASEPLRRVVSEAVAGFRALAHDPDARVLSGLGLVQAMTRGFLNVFLVVIALELVGSGTSGVGLLGAAVGVGHAPGSLGAAVLVNGHRLAVIMGVGVALWGLPIALSGVVAYRPGTVAMMCVIGVGNALVDIGFFTVTARLVPEGVLARAFGVFESLAVLSVGIGSLIAPLVIDLLGVRGALVLLGIIAPASAALAGRRLRAIDGSLARRDHKIALLQRLDALRLLPISAIDSLAAHVRRVYFPAGEDVLTAGDAGELFYLIDAGEVDMIADGSVIRTIGPGHGFDASWQATPRTATVRARTPLEVYTVERRRFTRAVSGYVSMPPEMGLGIAVS